VLNFEEKCANDAPGAGGDNMVDPASVRTYGTIPPCVHRYEIAFYSQPTYKINR